ncbi:MAG TPA: hypothetical protein VHO26_07975 [Propionibacteriaceae bacterium]|nr:hypothetical protein [Propionibacteriaceae bacterium]HEX2857398.1 hypothetical protein [Propionibacteriaceae bacterium]
MPTLSPLAALVPLDAGFVHYGFINLSVPNLVVIGAMLVLFVLALVVPFPEEES